MDAGRRKPLYYSDQILQVINITHCLSWVDTQSVHPTEVDVSRRPTGYIPTPASANFALGSDAVRGQLKVLHSATRWSRGQNPIDRNAMKTRKKRNTDESL